VLLKGRSRYGVKIIKIKMSKLFGFGVGYADDG
jgi:hypothetical protein